MPVTLTSRKDLDEILLRLGHALKRPATLLPIYLSIWSLHTTIVLLLSAFLLWVRLAWKCWTTIFEFFAFPVVITLRIQVYAIFWTLETFRDALIRCWECMDRIFATLEHSIQSTYDGTVASSRCGVPFPLELIPLILGHLREDKASLLNCTYVSHLFHDEANRILWAHLSLRHGLDIQKAYYGLVIFIEPNVPLINRRSLIKTIEIAGDHWSKDGPPSADDYNRLLYDLPSLKELVIEKKASHRMKFRSQYSSTGCPNLETIVMRDNSLELDIGFWNFVEAHENLKTLRYSASETIQKQLDTLLNGAAEAGHRHATLKPGTMPKLESVAAPALVVCRLVPGRPIKSVKIEGTLPIETGESIVGALCRSTAGIRHLDLELSQVNVELIFSKLSLLGDLEELVMRCSRLPRQHAIIAANFGFKDRAYMLKSLLRLTLVYRDRSYVCGYCATTARLFQAKCPRLMEIMIQGRRMTYILTRTNDGWSERNVGSGEVRGGV